MNRHNVVSFVIGRTAKMALNKPPACSWKPLVLSRIAILAINADIEIGARVPKVFNGSFADWNNNPIVRRFPAFNAVQRALFVILTLGNRSVKKLVINVIYLL